MPKKEYRFIGIKFDPDEDADLLEWIECHENMSECIKEAVRYYYEDFVMNDPFGPGVAQWIESQESEDK